MNYETMDWPANSYYEINKFLNSMIITLMVGRCCTLLLFWRWTAKFSMLIIYTENCLGVLNMLFIKGYASNFHGVKYCDLFWFLWLLYVGVLYGSCDWFYVILGHSWLYKSLEQSYSDGLFLDRTVLFWVTV